MVKKYIWHKQSMASGLETIDCLVYDPIKDFRRDPSGFYVLIRVDPKTALIEVAICDKRHAIIKVFRGKKCQDIYQAIFNDEKEHGCEWFTRKNHIAYLGKELKKAEQALMARQEYIQE